MDRPPACDEDAEGALDDLFDAIRICAPSTVSDMCAFAVTFDFNAAGCVEYAYAVTRPPGVEAAAADKVVRYAADRAIARRWPCLRGLHRVGTSCP